MANLMQEIYKRKTWGQIGHDFVGAIKDGVDMAIERQQQRLLRKIVAAFIMVLGTIYFLNGLAVFIGQLVSDQGWPGYLLVGFVMLLVGAITIKVK